MSPVPARDAIRRRVLSKVRIEARDDLFSCRTVNAPGHKFCKKFGQPLPSGAARAPDAKPIHFPPVLHALQDARAHCHVFFPWYNTEHHHAGLGLLTPGDVHHGLASQRIAARATVLATAYIAHPERFPSGLPHPPADPQEVWINPPQSPLPSQTDRKSVV